MDSNPQLIYARRDWLDRVSRSIRLWLESLAGRLRTEHGLVMEFECPNCRAKNPVAEILNFGNIYEFTCPACQSKFTVIIPAIQVRKGLIEETTRGATRN